MKVCILRNGYFPIDPRVRKEVYAHRDKGHEVDVICLSSDKRNKRKECVDGINIYRLPVKHKRKGRLSYIIEYGSAFFLFLIVVTLRHLKKKYDYIQVNTMPDFLIYATIIAKAMGAKVVLDMHEPTPELWITKYGNTSNCFFCSLQRYIEKQAISYSYKTIVVTEALKSRVSERGADKNKITVIPNVCENIYTEYKIDRKSSAGNLKLVTHGSIEERYGHDLIIKALAELKNDYPGISLDIFGSGEYEEEVKKLVKELECGSRVNFKGFVPFKQMLNEISVADVGIVAMLRSPYSELIDTNKLYEYISMGIPVIHSRLPVVEHNFDNSSIEFFEPGDYKELKAKIIKLLENPHVRFQLADNALVRMAAFKWDICKERYINVFS